MHNSRTCIHIFYGVIALSVNKKTGETLKKAGTYAFSTVCGALAAALLAAAFSSVMYILGLPPEIAEPLALIAFAAGCLLSGLVCGLIKGRGGLKNGLICALIMTAAVASVSLIAGGFDGSAAPSKLVTAVLSSCIGSVYGVNRK